MGDGFEKMDTKRYPIENIEAMEARIVELEAEAYLWKTRCGAAISLLPDGVRVGEMQEAERELKAERDRMAADCAVKDAIIQEISDIAHNCIGNGGVYSGSALDAIYGRASQALAALDKGEG